MTQIKCSFNIFIVLLISFLFFISCAQKGLDQSTMFKGRNTTNKKKGHYDTGTRKNKPMSVQLNQEYDKLSKHDTNPKKAAKKEAKELEKKKKASQKKTRKFREKSKYDIKKSKGKIKGDT